MINYLIKSMAKQKSSHNHFYQSFEPRGVCVQAVGSLDLHIPLYLRTLKVFFFFFLMLLFLGSVARSEDELVYNPYEDSWSYESSDAELQYNGYENEWEYVEPDEELVYNPMENDWEIAE